MQPLLSAIFNLCPHIIGQHTKIYIFHLYPTSVALMGKKSLMQPLLSAIFIFWPHIIGQCTKIQIFHLYPTYVALMDKKITHSTSPVSHFEFLSPYYWSAYKNAHFSSLSHLCSCYGLKNHSHNLSCHPFLIFDPISLISIHKYTFFIFIPPL